jgi:chemotaxis protein MotB
MRRVSVLAPASVWVVLGLSSTGCVPYATYEQTKKELAKAVDANNDLVKKYNQLMAKYMAKEKEGISDPAMAAELARLRQELAKSQMHPDFSKEDFDRLGAGVRNEEGGLQLGEALLFNEGEAKLKPEAFRTLDEIVDLLKGKYAGEMVIVEGHTDNQPLEKTKTLYQWNMKLGSERANAVFKYFLDHGIPESRLVVTSFSYNKPLDPATADSKEGRRQNRRVVIRRGGTQI